MQPGKLQERLYEQPGKLSRGINMNNKICPFISRVQLFDMQGAAEGTIIPDSGFVTMYASCAKNRCMAWTDNTTDGINCLLIRGKKE